MRNDASPSKKKLTEKEIHRRFSGLFGMQLLMDAHTEPPADVRQSVLQKHLGQNTELFGADAEGNYDFIMVSAGKYCMENPDYGEKPRFFLYKCKTAELSHLKNISKWDIEIFDKCCYHVFTASVSQPMCPVRIPPLTRWEMWMHYLDALYELYPQTKAVGFPYSSGRIFPVEMLLHREVLWEEVFDENKPVFNGA